MVILNSAGCSFWFLSTSVGTPHQRFAYPIRFHVIGCCAFDRTARHFAEKRENGQLIMHIIRRSAPARRIGEDSSNSLFATANFIFFGWF
jgi:hypothetical protein